MVPSALFVGSGRGICPHMFMLPGPAGLRSHRHKGHQSHRALCLPVTPPPPPCPMAFPQLPGPWPLGEPFSHPTSAPQHSSPARAAAHMAASTPGGSAMALTVEKPDTKVPGVGSRSPHATQPSGSLCTLSSTCGIFEDALGDLSWVA